MTSYFDSLHPLRSFRFSVSKTPLDWDKLVLDVDKIIATRDVQTLVSNLDILITCNIDTEIKRNGFSEMFIKLFRLSQLAIEFLLHCKTFLQKSLSHLEEELQLLKQGIIRDELKTSNKTIKKNKSRVVLTAAVERASFKCSICKKIFVSGRHLEHHKSRQHAQNRIHRQSKQNYFKVLDDGVGSHSFSNPNKTPVTFLSPDTNHNTKPSPDSKMLVNKSEESISSRSRATMRLEELLVNMEYDLPKLEENSSKTMLLTENSPELIKTLSGSLEELTLKSNKSVDRNNKAGEVNVKDLSEPGVCNSPPFSLEITKNQNVNIANVDKNILSIAQIQTVNPPPDGKLTDRCHNLHVQTDNFSKTYGSNSFYEEIENGKEYISDENISSTESETSSSSEDINRLRVEIEHEFENKLRSLGIDPEWHKIPFSVAKANEAILSALRKSHAKKDKNYYTIRNQLAVEVEQQLQSKTREGTIKLYSNQ